MNGAEGRAVDWKKYAAVTVSVSAALFAFWVFLRYGVRVLMPFLLAWVLSLLIAPLADGLARKTRLPRRLTAVVLLILVLLLIVCVLLFAVHRLFRELEGLFRFLGDDPEGLKENIQRLVEYFSEIGKNLPFLSLLSGVEGLEAVVGDVDVLVSNFLKDTVTGMTAKVSAAVGRVLTGTPSALLFLLVFLISSFYFCVDGDRIYRGIRALLPQRVSAWTVGLRARITSLLYRYLRVYLLLFLLTFVELLVGFMILGRNYAFLLALLISALDILPVFGVGTALLPWAVVLFLVKDAHGAIGLLILWGVITVVRQVVEPRLFGDSFGVHPLVALVSLYAGLKLFGVVGLILGPALAVFLKLLVSEVRGGKGEQGENTEKAQRYNT